jgi:hypothetical protein
MKTMEARCCMVAVLGGMTVGCGGQPDATDGEENIGVSQQAVKLGIFDDNSGIVRIGTGTPFVTKCLGVLLTNNTVITSFACAINHPEPEPTAVKMEPQVATITKVAWSGEFAMMLRVDPPLSVNGSTSGYLRPVFDGPSSALNGQTRWTPQTFGPIVLELESSVLTFIPDGGLFDLDAPEFGARKLGAPVLLAVGNGAPSWRVDAFVECGFDLVNCVGVGAERWRTWAALTLLSGW